MSEVVREDWENVRQGPNDDLLTVGSRLSNVSQGSTDGVTWRTLLSVFAFFGIIRGSGEDAEVQLVQAHETESET